MILSIDPLQAPPVIGADGGVDGEADTAVEFRYRIASHYKTLALVAVR